MTEGQKRYREYLQSDHWKTPNVARGKKCIACNTKLHLDLHHVVYPSDWYKTTRQHVCWLCRDCHTLFHKTFGVTLDNPDGRCALGLRHDTKKLLRRLRGKPVWKNPDKFGSERPTTGEEIEAKKTLKGGFTRRQLELWGVNWPPVKGWKQEVLRRNSR